MSDFVLDACVAVAWICDDETSVRADTALSQLKVGEALVPPLWHLEVRSALLRAERRGRLSSAEVDDGLLILHELPIYTADEPDLDSLIPLARKHRISCYDAVYLGLALRRKSALATLDTALAGAALRERVTLI